MSRGETITNELQWSRREQQSYARGRIPELVHELSKVLDEKKQLADKRRSGGLSEAERRKLNQRWAYLGLRYNVLRLERKQLSEYLALSRQRTQAALSDD